MGRVYGAFWFNTVDIWTFNVNFEQLSNIYLVNASNEINTTAAHVCNNMYIKNHLTLLYDTEGLIKNI